MLARNLDAAAARLSDCIALFRELGQQQGVGRSLGILGFVHLYQQQRGPAERVFEDALAIVESLDDAWGTGQASLGLGLAAKSRDDKDAATALPVSRDLVPRYGGRCDHPRRCAEHPRRPHIPGRSAAGCPLRCGGRGVPHTDRRASTRPATVAELEAIRARGIERLGEMECDSQWEAGSAAEPG